MPTRLAPLAVALLAAEAAAQPAADPAVKAFLARHCVECHGPTTQKADFRVDDLPADFANPDAHTRWKAALERVAAGTMPPAKKPRPARADADAFTGWVTGRLAAVEKERQKAEGRAVLRRLNRTEYENTVRDLLGVSVDVKDLLPADAISHGFDNQAEALSVSDVQLQRYLEAAELALDAAVARGPKPDTKTVRFTYDSGRQAAHIGVHWLKRPDGAVVLLNDGGFPSTQVEGFRAHAAGRYTVTVTGYAHNSRLPLPFGVTVGSFGRTGDLRRDGFHDLPPGPTPSTVTFTLDLEPGDSFKLQPFGLSGFPLFKKNNPDKLDQYPGPGLAVKEVLVEGPVGLEWPPRGHKLLFGDLPLRPAPKGTPPPKGRFGPSLDVYSANPPADARRLLPTFLMYAFRRPVTPEQAAPYLNLALAELKQGATFREAMLAAAAAALCSPDFLYLREKPGRLDDFALASRLSYFLWRTMPDEELLALAAKKQLSRPEVLKAQTERLLKHPNARRFAADFTDAWLNLRDIDFTAPDKLLYPEFDDLLQDSMVKETRGFFQEVVDKNLPADTFLASDWGMLNERLALHYGVPGVTGSAVRRVPLPPASGRGGLLTQGAVLKVSANGTNTSPVVRGVYVLERFLGVHPPPPPPGVPAVEPDIRGAKTVRELLDKHRNTEQCAGCHRLIDPPGFALEEFDVIGGRRDRFRTLPDKPAGPPPVVVNGIKARFRYGPPVDAAGVLNDGRAFKNFEQFRRLLVARPEPFAECLTEKLLAFATGREAGPADEPEVKQIVSAAAAGKYAVRDLVHAVVQSEPFRTK